MNQDRITELAKQAGLLRVGDGWSEPARWGITEIKAFAELVRAEALEDAAKAVDELADGDDADTAQQFALDIASDKIRELK